METYEPIDDFRLEFSTDELASHSPAQYFSGIAEVLEAMQVLDANLVAFILPSARTTQRLQQVTSGSIRTKIASIIEYIPDDVLRTGDWKRVCGHFLVDGRKAVLHWLRKEPKVRDEAQLESLAIELDRLASVSESPVKPRRFSRRLLLSVVVRLIRGAQALPGKETVTAIINQERIVLPRNAEVTTAVVQSVAEAEVEPFEQEMRLLVKKPDMIGNSQWDFLDRGYVVRAKMSDTGWVDSYHKNQLALKPGDGIEARVRLTPKHGTSDLAYNYEVVQVRNVIPSGITQQSMLFED